MTPAIAARASFAPLVSLLLSGFLGGPALAAADERGLDLTIAVRPVAAPALFQVTSAAPGGADEVDTETEASAVEPIGDGSVFVVAHDKKAPLRLVDAASGRVLGTLTTPAFEGLSPKWEGMARDSDGTIYVIGSHSGKTYQERLDRGFLFRFRLVPSATSANPSDLAIDPASVAHWELGDALVRALSEESLPQAAIDQRKIEGLTIRETAPVNGGERRRELVIGLRQPDDLVRTYAVDLAALGESGSAFPALTRLFTFDPGQIEGVRCQLTSLEYVEALGGFLVITATEDEQNAFHGNLLWLVPNDRIDQTPGQPLKADAIWSFEPKMKAEGLCILPAPANPNAHAAPSDVRILITYDNDAHVTHIPSCYQFIDLVRHPAGR